jgi:threonine/homoserine/homoserine lactone efflux protein
LIAALVVAVVPGPGIFYVAARTLSDGRKVGIASTLGTGLGGLVHAIAGSLGVSAIILASAEAFAALKFAGAPYLIWLGIRAFRDAGDLPVETAKGAGTVQAFREGILVEATNPKTAAFFLAFIPQFLDVAAPHPALQFVALGLISVTLNTIADRGFGDARRLRAEAATGSKAASELWPVHDGARRIVTAGKAARNELAQHTRMHPPGGVIAPDRLGGGVSLQAVGEDRKAGGARSRHAREQHAVARAKRGKHLANDRLDAHRGRFQIIGNDRQRLDPIANRRAAIRPGR